MSILAKTFAAILLTGTAFAADCQPEAQLTLTPDWYGGPTVDLPIAGTPMTLLVDTGGVKSMLTRTATARLGLVHKPITDSLVTLYGGAQINHTVNLPKTDMTPGEFYVMPDNRLPYALSGTLAPDILSTHDVGFDFVKAEMRFFAPGQCTLSHALAIRPDDAHHLIVTVELDGERIPAFLDTGASRSELSYETARRLFGSAMRAAEPAHRADSEDGVLTYPFETLRVGNVSVDAPDIILVPDNIARRPADAPRLLLGMNILRRMKLFVAYGRNRLMVSPAEDR
jgi:predicted aspartyl protease